MPKNFDIYCVSRARIRIVFFSLPILLLCCGAFLTPYHLRAAGDLRVLQPKPDVVIGEVGVLLVGDEHDPEGGALVADDGPVGAVLVDAVEAAPAVPILVGANDRTGALQKNKEKT